MFCREKGERNRAAANRRPRLLVNWVGGVEIQIEFENVDARLADETEVASGRMLSDQMPNIGLAHSAFMRDTRNLKFGSGRRDVRVEAGAR